MIPDLSTPHTNDTAMQFALYFKSAWQPYFFLLWKRLQDGHICVAREELKSEFIKEKFPLFTDETPDEEEFISDTSAVRPIVSLNNKLYLQRYFKYETIIVEKVKELASSSSLKTGTFNKKLINGGGLDWQKIAAATCLQSDFTIITGGPGTGKTTTVAFILQFLFTQNPEYTVALAAPTGKAAARMAESLQEKAGNYPDNLKELFLKLEPSTIHRLLGSKTDSIRFKHNAENPLDYDIIIIDESSMIDVALFAKFLSAVKKGTKLILLGDKNQLASVEAGSLFGDLCSIPEKLNEFSAEFVKKINQLATKNLDLPVNESPSAISDHIIELKKSYRFSSEKGIGRLSNIVIHENTEALENFIRNKDEVVNIDLNYDEKLFERFVLKFKSYLKEEDISQALKKLNDSRVLCALREGYFGLYEINNRIENFLEKEGLIRRNHEFYFNRPVIITRNNYSLGLFNGDTGIVRKDKEGNLKVWFDVNGELTGFAPSLISNADTSFALTIHKSQGSEFAEVLIILPDFDVPVLTKELVYTAITRAKTQVLLQTSETVLKNTIRKSVKRGSGLKERF